MILKEDDIKKRFIDQAHKIVDALIAKEKNKARHEKETLSLISSPVISLFSEYFMFRIDLDYDKH
jgi:hypothetical protein